jgi:hypothetical protein
MRAKGTSRGRNSRLPKGIVRKGRSLIVDADIDVVRIAPNLVIFARQKDGAGAGNTVGWGSCTCDKSGGCKAVITPLPGGNKFTFTCASTGCTGTCTAHAGTVPDKIALAAAILQVVQRN